MPNTPDRPRYGDTDADRVLAPPAAILAGWVVVIGLIVLAAVPSMVTNVGHGAVAVARAAHLELRQQVARVPGLPWKPQRTDEAC
ncbi:MAG: hypothetical protein JO021_01930 [Alphaproteobacteria bacterium]|nr:hypothetical protein [Alphaproteobacteria bacterium]